MAQNDTRLSALAILAIVVTGIAVAFIAQSFGLSFRLSIALSALVVGISISIVHYFQDSGASASHSESRSQHN
jgi:membrane protein implicated in regulation of membrane protease activity